jgi:glyoxylase-like metal-dependent hydrolase (beta-lactamase superfamily II)
MNPLPDRDPIAFEDHALDVLKKAALGMQADGQRLSPVLREALRVAFREQRLPDGPCLESLCESLELDFDALQELHACPVLPCPAPMPGGCRDWVFPFGEGVVHAYGLHLPGTRKVWVFDCGTHAGPILEDLEREGLELSDLWITHGHRDHLGGLEELMRRYPGLRLHGHRDGPLASRFALAPEPVEAEGGICIRSTAIGGHADDALVYRVDGFERTLLITGDTIFARSFGGMAKDYRKNRLLMARLLETSPPDALILPGHGPRTVVELERARHPALSMRILPL